MIGFWGFLKKSQQTVQKMAQLNEKKNFFLSIKEKEGMTRHQWNNWDAEALVQQVLPVFSDTDLYFRVQIPSAI